VVYTATDTETVDKELARAATRAGVRIEDMRPRNLAMIRVEMSRVLDLTRPNVRAALGLSIDEATADDPALTRRIGEAAHHVGYEAVLAPSAAGAGSVLAIFLDNRAADSVVEIVEIKEDYVPSLQ